MIVPLLLKFNLLFDILFLSSLFFIIRITINCPCSIFIFSYHFSILLYFVNNWLRIKRVLVYNIIGLCSLYITDALLNLSIDIWAILVSNLNACIITSKYQNLYCKLYYLIHIANAFLKWINFNLIIYFDYLLMDF